MKITGVKKAVGTCKRANEGGFYRSTMGVLMVDCSTGYVWCDELTCDSWVNYEDKNIAYLEWDGEATMKNIKAAAERMCAEHIA